MPGVRRRGDGEGMRSLSDRPGPASLARLGILGALTLCWFSGLAARRHHLSTGDVTYRYDFQVAAISGLAIATVLALGLLVLAALRAPWWLLLVTAAAAAHHVVLALAAFQHSLSAPVNLDVGSSAVQAVPTVPPTVSCPAPGPWWSWSWPRQSPCSWAGGPPLRGRSAARRVPGSSPPSSWRR